MHRAAARQLSVSSRRPRGSARPPLIGKAPAQPLPCMQEIGRSGLARNGPVEPAPRAHCAPMSTPILVFTHANSFPPGCYRLLTEAWQAAGWRVLATPMLGHQAQHPVTANWTHLADELLGFVDRELPKQQPVAWVGHSLGGLLSLMAAARRPAQSRAVVQLDSPYVRGWRAGLVRFGRLTGLSHRVPPAAIAHQRRNHWPDAEAVRAHFATKAFVQRWDARVFEDFLRECFEPHPAGGLRLRFRREVEAAIYATLPGNLSGHVRRLRAPLGFVAGTQSLEMRQGGLAATRALVGAAHWREIEGTHLFPFEQPLATAQVVLELLAALTRLPGPGR